MVTKAENMAKPRTNFPAPQAATGDPTAYYPIAGKIPNVAPVNQYDPGYPVQGTPSRMPQPKDTLLQVIANPVPGNTDTGVGHSGDLGGAA